MGFTCRLKKSKTIIVIGLLIFSCIHSNNVTSANHDSRLYSRNLVYKGAFAFPDADEWTYGGHALAYYPQGDPGGTNDGYPGSLYTVGHAWYQLVGEISIPPPVISDNYDRLPRAKILRTQQDITSGNISNCVYYNQQGQQETCEYREVAGLVYIEKVNKIVWNLRDWYNVGGLDQDSMGWSKLDLTDAQGVWHIGQRFDSEFHNARTCNYLFKAPQSFANQYLEGKSLISGNHREAGAFGGSQGPTLYASAPWENGNPPAPRTQLDALALVYYPENYPACIDDPTQCSFPNYRVDDQWGGGAWVNANGKNAILIFGRKGLGDNYYGVGRPGDCSIYKGWHSDPYQTEILFYDPEDIKAVVAGQTDPWLVVPYEVYLPHNETFNPQCGVFESVSYDQDRHLIYVVENTGEGRSAVHVWGINVDTSIRSVPAIVNFFLLIGN